MSTKTTNLRKKKKFRDWNAVVAQFRNSAGPIKSKKKKKLDKIIKKEMEKDSDK